MFVLQFYAGFTDLVLFYRFSFVLQFSRQRRSHILIEITYKVCWQSAWLHLLPQ